MKTIFFLKLLLFPLIFLPYISYADVRAPRNPKSAKGCAICHYRWIDTFFIDGKGSDLVVYESKKVVARPEMCLSCHDGSVMDSRKKVNNDYGHKTDIPPPPDMKLPQTFPLDENGKIYCATCHTAHGVPSGEGTKTTIFMRTSNIDSAMCRMCHPDMDGGIEAGHHPAGTIQKEVPEKLIALGSMVGTVKNRFICETCHIAHGSLYAGFLIDSVGDSTFCLNCHKDKNVFTPDGKKQPFHIINVEPVHAKIPEALFKQGAKLGYNGTITCQTCHKVHKNKIEEQLLLIKKDKKSTLCLTCHGDKKYLASTKHNLTNSAPREKNLEGKTAEQAGVCSACHLPHKSARKLSGNKDAATKLCLSCHSRGNMAENKRFVGEQHPINIHPLRTNDKEQLILPLFNQNGIRDKNGVMTCATCHDPHCWDPLNPASENRFDVEGNSQNSFLRLENSPSPKLCGSCHPDEAYIEKTDHDLIVTAPLSRNIIDQTPFESGTCGVCHLVHNSKNKIRLWAQGFAMGYNVMERMCNSCHSEAGCAKNNTPQVSFHPREKLIKNIGKNIKGRPDYFPLFHGESGEPITKGNISCPSCHNVHQWNPIIYTKGKGINLEGDATNSFLRQQASRAICADCHGPDAPLKIKYYHNADKRVYKGIDALFF